MTTTADLKDFERRAWRSVFADGLWDIALGCVFLGTGLTMSLSLSRGWGYLFYAAIVALGIAALLIGKRRITIPRLGWVRFGPKGQKRRRNVIIVLAVGLILTAALIPLTVLARSNLPRVHGPAGTLPVLRILSSLAVSALVWAVLSVMAAFWEFPRLYAHALIIAGSFFAVEMLSRGWPLIAGSAIVLAIGVGSLIRFLKAYPKPAPEAPDGGSGS